MVKVLVVDDQDLVRDAIVQLLSDVPGIEIVGQACSGEEALQCIKEKDPQVVLMDIHMPGIGGLQTIERILAKDRKVKIIVLTAYRHEIFPAKLLALGVQGYLTKGASVEEMLEAIHTVMEGGVYLQPRVSRKLVEKKVLSEKACLMEALSAREFDVMLKIAQGISPEMIAEKLYISLKTLHSYRYRLYKKLELNNDVELSRFVMEQGLLETVELE